MKVLPEFEICPTLDLRIDHMHAAEPGKDVYGFAECYRVTPNVIFTRGYAYQDDPSQPIAHVVGAFMRMGKAAQSSVNWNNNIVRMVNAGSKGSFINISQMMACVGQQNVEVGGC